MKPLLQAQSESRRLSGKPELLKHMNEQLILKLIVRYGEISRAQLARETGLALPSVMRLVDGLEAEGFLETIGKGDSTGGRKPNLVRIHRQYKMVIGIEIARCSTIAITDFGGHLMALWTSPPLDDMTPEAVLQRLLDQMRVLMKEHQLTDDQIAGIGIGTPGMNFKYLQTVKRSILKGWEAFDIQRWFEERTPYLIIADNVARTQTLSEVWFGHGRKRDNFLYVYVDQGVGIGIVENGLIYEGANGVAGEFGHMSIDRAGRHCYCGKVGCVEMYVSAGALLNDVEQLRQSGAIEPSLWVEPVSLEQLAQHGGQTPVEALQLQAGETLAFALGNVVNLYNPEAIVLGGAVSRLCPTFVNQIRLKLPQYIFHNHAVETPIFLSALNDEQACLGGVALVIQNCMKLNR